MTSFRRHYSRRKRRELFFVEKTRNKMADASAAPKKRTFRKFEYRGIDLDKILKLSENELYDLFRARCRRHRARVGNKPQYLHLVEKCVKSKEGLEPGMKPNPVKTHLRNAIIVPAMIGAIVAVHNGKTFTGVEIKVFSFPLNQHFL